MKTIGKIADWYLWILSALLPMRMGSLGLLPGTTSYFPEQITNYLIAIWPPTFTAIPIGIGLLLAYLSIPEKNKISFSPLTLGWLALFVGSFFFGGFFISSPENRIYYYAHFLTLAVFLCSIALRSNENPKFKYGFIFAIALGTIYSVADGVYQYCFGFAETRKLIAQQIKEGAIFPEEYLKRANDNRIYANFSSCNNFAGYLLLTIPLTGALIWRILGEVKPPLTSRLLLGIPTIAMMITVLILTKSRAAFLTLATVAAAALFFVKFKSIYKILLALFIIAVIGGGAFYIHTRGRGFISMEVRADYLRSSLQMLTDHPFLGSGWGEFYYKHQTYMTLGIDEAAHDPHNIVATYASQAGLPGLLGISVMLIWSLAAFYRSFKKNKEEKLIYAATLLGGALWVMHSLMDANFMYVASFGLFLAMVVLFADGGGRPIFCRYATHILIIPAAIASIVAGLYLTRGEYLLDQVRNADKPIKLADAYADAVKWRPHSGALNTIAAYHYMQMNRNDKALELLDLAIKYDPELASLYWEKATLLRQKGDINGAEKALESFYLLSPKSKRTP